MGSFEEDAAFARSQLFFQSPVGHGAVRIAEVTGFVLTIQQALFYLRIGIGSPGHYRAYFGMIVTK